MINIQYSSLFELLNHYSCFTYNIKVKYLELLSLLTTVEDITAEKFAETVGNISQFGSVIMVGYISKPDLLDFVIVCSGTLIIEPKIIHGCKKVGHIEDIVVHTNHRGKGLSQILLNMLRNYAIKNDCYKVILDCNENVKSVYIKNGFEEKGLQMALYFNH